MPVLDFVDPNICCRGCVFQDKCRDSIENQVDSVLLAIDSLGTFLDIIGKVGPLISLSRSGLLTPVHVGKGQGSTRDRMNGEKKKSDERRQTYWLKARMAKTKMDLILDLTRRTEDFGWIQLSYIPNLSFQSSTFNGVGYCFESSLWWLSFCLGRIQLDPSIQLWFDIFEYQLVMVKTIKVSFARSFDCFYLLCFNVAILFAVSLFNLFSVSCLLLVEQPRTAFLPLSNTCGAQ